jgi:hypothetical protein
MAGLYATRRAVRAARRIYPLVLVAYRHWDQLSPQEKERYRQQARRYAEQSAGYARQGAGHARQALSKVPTDRFRKGGR